MWCLAAIPIKWAIAFTLLRIANKRKAYQWSIYVMMAAVAIVMASTTMYEFFHCKPIPMNWRTVEGGSCLPQSNITGFSFALSVVSIASDWFCALIPIPLLWNVQLDFRVKLSVLALLGLGVFASSAALIRLTITVNLSSTSDFLYHAMPVAAWAQVELGLGVIVGNLPALRPLLEKLLQIRSTLNSNKRSDKKTSDRYLELGEGLSRRTSSKNGTVASKQGPKTNIYGGDLVDNFGGPRHSRHTRRSLEEMNIDQGLFAHLKLIITNTFIQCKRLRSDQACFDD
ncbi:hypothetical protein P153DRAFT_378779 [Dothidotthia symphoricarpi CBS 119687]|uniref:Rhodopsin domain-containing protein n=1 Tax=Dothidotthia symphoricarpi CBS 119687 TaxID=1392245 RepID=A0A6A6A317_9PLEO|nr:uncharacterized protein P153DRAFT_378779 [Dothidotthia symphoricarpi CBS 119687]KAF2125297.1 hypothetical protein P153DRAFT_378779 [Dothidotthia symphoricarpi CBS 119687]